MRNPNRVLDKTFLSANNADERVIRHRDLASHAFRWANVARYLSKNHTYKDAIVLDVGCGKEMPLARMLYSNRLIPRKYVGVDVNRFSIPDMLVGKKIPVSIWTETDFCALDVPDVGEEFGKIPELPGYEHHVNSTDNDVHLCAPTGKLYSKPNVVVCFEVLEHVLPAHARQMLVKMMELTSRDCHYFISTPCWDQVNVAENHISEFRVDALGALFEDLGFKIDGFWGTFASQKDYKPVMEQRFPGITDVFNKLSEYYDSTVISIIFAPLFPMESRNCLWHLTKKKGDAASQDRLFSALEQVPEPWTSSASWKDLNGT